jgi:hypothetical protein
MKSVDPHCLMMFNQTWKYSQVAHGGSLNPEAWPTDIALAEDAVPLEYHHDFMEFEGQKYYVPLAPWIPSGPFYHMSKWREWFWGPHFETRAAAELFPLYRDTVTRNASFCLNLSPDTRGQIADEAVQQLRELSGLIKADRDLRKHL